MADNFHPQQSPMTLPVATNDYTKDGEAATRRRLEQALQVMHARLVLLEAVIETQQPAITDPAGGGTIDAQARAALIAVLDALRAHGLIGT